MNQKESLTAIQKSSNWIAPENEGIANIWLKYLPVVHDDLAYASNNYIENQEESPSWLTTDATYLLQNVHNPNIHERI